MSIRTRTLLTILLTVAVLTFGLYLFSKTVLMESFQKLELREAENNIERARNVVQERFLQLEAKIADWARWDDAYQFVQDGNQDFIDANLMDQSGGNMKINHLLFYDNNRRLMGKIGWDLVKSEAIPVPESILSFFQTDDYFFTNYASIEDFKRGFVLFDGKPSLIVAAPVTTSETKGPVMGTLVFIRYLTPELVANLSEVVRLSLEAKTWEEMQSADGNWTLAKELKPNEGHNLNAVNNQTMIAHLLFKDWQEKPALVLQLRLNRDIMGVGVSTINSLLAGVGIFAAILVLALLLSLELNVIRRIVHLGHQVTLIGAQNKSGQRVDVAGSDEITVLSQEINQMLGSIEEKTNAIQAILDHVAFGLLLCDKEGKVLPGYSRSTAKLFQKPANTSLANQHIWDLLALNNRDKENFSSLYYQIFDTDFLAEELTSQIPLRHKIADRTITLTGSPIFSEQGEVQCLLFSIADISKLVQAEQENTHNRSLLRILKSRDNFAQLTMRVLKESSDQGSIEALKQKGVSEEQLMKLLRRHLHTWKGDFSVYGLSKIASHIHHLEDSLQNSTEAQTEMRGISKQLEDFISENNSLLSLDIKRLNEKTYTVRSSDLQALSASAQSDESFQNLAGKVLDFVNRTHAKSASNVFSHMLDGAHELANRQSKKLNVIFQGDNTVLPEDYTEVYDSFVHLFRNAVDHGVESPADRKQKNPISTLTFTVSSDATGFHFELHDDGRGIDTDLIKIKALKMNLISAKEWDEMSAEQRLRIILRTGFTTRDIVSDVSGRGIGLDAVESSVTAAGGKVEISSQLGQGTRFKISLPPLKQSNQRKHAA